MLVKNVNIKKHVKILQHVSIIIQIIFRDLGRLLFKAIELEIVKDHCCDEEA